MSSSDPYNNKRKSVRCTVTKARQYSTLIVGERKYPVQLIDESLGGYAVLINGFPGMRVGDVARLQTDWGLFEVRLARIARVESPLDNESPKAGEPGSWHRLGLCRMGEALPPPPKTASVFSERSSLYRGPWNSSGGVLLASGLIIVLLITGFSLGILKIHWNTQNWATNSATTSESPTVKFNRKMSESIHRTPGASALLLPDVTKELSLSKDQVKGIRRLLDEMSKAMQIIDHEASSKDLQRWQLSEIRDKLHVEARKEALKLLTEEQLEKWRALDAKP
jgi:hypothetical protein